MTSVSCLADWAGCCLFIRVWVVPLKSVLSTCKWPWLCMSFHLASLLFRVPLKPVSISLTWAKPYSRLTWRRAVPTDRNKAEEANHTDHTGLPTPSSHRPSRTFPPTPHSPVQLPSSSSEHVTPPSFGFRRTPGSLASPYHLRSHRRVSWTPLRHSESHPLRYPTVPASLP